MVLHSGSSARGQHGAALLVSLLLLLGMTIVGIASMRETVTQQRAINAAIEDDTAFQAAEYALRAAERFVQTQAGVDSKSLQGERTVAGVTFFGEVLAMNWWKNRYNAAWDRGPEVTTYPRVSSGQRRPSYVIEELGRDSTGGSLDVAKDQNTVQNYRITARGFGVNENYYVVLQSTIGVRQ